MPHPRYVGLRISTDAEAVPTSADLDQGELGINVASGRLYVCFGEHVRDITDRYTRAEIDQLMQGKASASHNHPWSEVTGKPGTATRWPAFSEVTDKPTVYPSEEHTHTLSQITDAGTAASADTSDFEPSGSASASVEAHETADNPHAQYVLKAAGKGLSSEDYTAAEKSKLSGVEVGAEANPIIVDALNSTASGQPLSANQGRVLKGLIDTINTALQSDDGTLDELQEIVDYIKLNRDELETLSIPSIAGLQSALEGKQPLDSVLTATTAAFTTALLSKLSGIESGATADQTKSDIDELGINADTVNGMHASDFDAAGSAAQAAHDLRETLRRRPDPLLMHFL